MNSPRISALSRQRISAIGGTVNCQVRNKVACRETAALSSVPGGGKFDRATPRPHPGHARFRVSLSSEQRGRTGDGRTGAHGWTCSNVSDGPPSQQVGGERWRDRSAGNEIGLCQGGPDGPVKESTGPGGGRAVHAPGPALLGRDDHDFVEFCLIGRQLGLTGRVVARVQNERQHVGVLLIRQTPRPIFRHGHLDALEHRAHR